MDVIKLFSYHSDKFN